MRRLAVTLIAAGALAVWSASAAFAASPPDTGTFTFTDHFVVQPGDPASCSFPITVDVAGRGSFQVFHDASGEPTRLLLHQTWTGTGTANGKHVIEHAAQNDAVDLVTGASTNAGQIHDQIPFGGVVIHDVGLLRFDGQGNLTFEAGPHQGFSGDVAGLCAALT
jgi:hypothetical protein